MTEGVGMFGVIIQQSDMMAVKYSCWRVRTHTPFFWQTTF